MQLNIFDLEMAMHLWLLVVVKGGYPIMKLNELYLFTEKDSLLQKTWASMQQNMNEVNGVDSFTEKDQLIQKTICVYLIKVESCPIKCVLINFCNGHVCHEKLGTNFNHGGYHQQRFILKM